MQNGSMNHEWCDVVFVRRISTLLQSKLRRLETGIVEYDCDIISSSASKNTKISRSYVLLRHGNSTGHNLSSVDRTNFTC